MENASGQIYSEEAIKGLYDLGARFVLTMVEAPALSMKPGKPIAAERGWQLRPPAVRRSPIEVMKHLSRTDIHPSLGVEPFMDGLLHVYDSDYRWEYLAPFFRLQFGDRLLLTTRSYSGKYHHWIKGVAVSGSTILTSKRLIPYGATDSIGDLKQKDGYISAMDYIVLYDTVAALPKTRPPKSDWEKTFAKNPVFSMALIPEGMRNELTLDLLIYLLRAKVKDDTLAMMEVGYRLATGKDNFERTLASAKERVERGMFPRAEFWALFKGFDSRGHRGFEEVLTQAGFSVALNDVTGVIEVTKKAEDGAILYRTDLDKNVRAELVVETADLHAHRREMFASQLRYAAIRNRYNPVIDYLTDCADRYASPRNAGKLALSVWENLNIPDEDRRLYQEVFNALLKTAAMRALVPGVEAPVLFTLIGRSRSGGEGKTDFLKILGTWKKSDPRPYEVPFETSYYKELDEFPHDAKKLMEVIHGLWIVELGEMAKMYMRDQNSVKTLISVASDRARSAYAEDAATVQRGCVFCATTNEDQFLRITTGLRRFVNIDVTGARLNRDKWRDVKEEALAYAFQHVRASVSAGNFESHFIPSAIRDALMEKAEKSVVITPDAHVFEDLVMRAKAGDAITMAEIARYCKDLQIRKPQTAELRDYGFTSELRRIGGRKPARYWVFKADETIERQLLPIFGDENMAAFDFINN